MSLSNDAFDSENIYKCEKLYAKKVYFDTYFSIVHISLNFALNNLKFCGAVDDIPIEGTMSQIFVLSLRFHFMSKNGQLFNLFFLIFCSSFYKRRTRT